MKVKNPFKLFAPFLIFILYGCPGEELGFDDRYEVIPDLAKIEPLQETYNVGDEIIYSIVVSSKYEQFGNSEEPVDVFRETGVIETMFSGEIHRFDGNDITVIEGKNAILSNTSVAYLTYYPEENNYRYKAKIKFTTPGVYTLYLNSMGISFPNKNEGYNYSISTNVVGITNNDGYIFTVE